MKPADADATLKQLRRPDWKPHRLAALARLPPRLAEAGRALLAVGKDGAPLGTWDAIHRAEDAAVRHLERMSLRERGKVFAAFFPRLARHLEAGWQLTFQMPYEVDSALKAFRAPTVPDATRPHREVWLHTLLHCLEGLDPDVVWLAAWAPHLTRYFGADEVGVLLGAAIDHGGPEGDEVFAVLCASARGRHPVGAMGRHVVRALLVSSRPEGWGLLEELLLGKKAEPLRQVVFESIDEAHPEACRRLLKLILGHNLAASGDTVRALDVWFGYQWDAVSVRVVNHVLERVVRFLDDPKARAKALAGADAEAAYLALWALAFEDALAAVKPAAKLLTGRDVEKRFAAVHLLGQLGLPAARPHLLKAVDDPDLRVALRALEGLQEEGDGGADRGVAGTDLFERVERLLKRMPEKRTPLGPIVWPWHVFVADRQEVAADLEDALGRRPPSRLLPHLALLPSWARARVVQRIVAGPKPDKKTRAALVGLLGDAGAAVREEALKGIAKGALSKAEAVKLEGLLGRGPADLRHGVVAVLAAQKDAAALASADRLLEAEAAPERLAGLELMRLLARAGRCRAECRSRAVAYRRRPRLTAAEKKQLSVFLKRFR